MPYSASDITIVSWGRLMGGDSESRWNLCQIHLHGLRQTGCPFQFVDSGSIPEIEGEGVIRLNTDYDTEADCKNMGLEKVTTRIVAFTDWRSIITPRTIQSTLELLNKEGCKNNFILQAYPWEMPLRAKYMIAWDSLDALWHRMSIIENLSIPHAAPKLHMGAWQVCQTEDARLIGGWNGNIEIDGAAEFHERMRSWVSVINGDNTGEIIVRDIPVVTGDYQLKGEQVIRDLEWTTPLSQFVETGEAKALDWRAA